MMATDDQDVFDDDEETTEETDKVEAKSENSETESKEEDKTETEETKEETQSSEKLLKQVAGLKAGIADERRKRQEAQAQVKKQDAVKVEVPDPVADPDAFNEFQDNRLNARDLKLKIEMSQSWARKAHEDYNDVEKVFIGLITDDDGNITDQTLVDKFNAAELPADFAYDHVKSMQLSTYRGSDDYETSIRADERKKILEEAREQGVNAADLPDLTNAAASASNSKDIEQTDPDRIDAFD